jgi:peptidyl-prolyl cis-trans isomerase D
VDGVLEEIINRSAMQAFGEKHGLIAGERLIDSEIAKIPAFRGVDGQFSDAAYRQALAQRGLTDEQVREDLGQGLISRQLLAPADIGVAAPDSALLRYAGIITERRSGAIAMLPSAAFAPKSQPTDAEVSAWYASHTADYMRPERRVIRYATFNESALKNVPAPTEAEIAARYNANKAQYAASETRNVTQLILPTEAAARAVLAEVLSGKSLDTIAGEKGLSTAKLTKLSRDALSGQASQAVADATFGAAQGKIAGPAKSALGWHLMRIDAIESKPARTLDQVRGELVEQLSVEKRRTALSDFSAKIEDEFDNGATLADVTKELAINLSQTGELTADGQVYGQAGEAAPPLLARAIQTAFSMEREGQPQLAEIEAGKTFLIFDVSSIIPSAAAPLAEIRQQVVTDVQLSKGAIAAKAAAQKVESLVRQGVDMQMALSGLGVALPPVDRVDMPRQQLQAMGEQAAPPIKILFAMAKGSTKLLGAPRNRGWYVVELKNIVPGNVAINDPRLAGFRREINQVVAREFEQQLVAAMRNEVGVKRNDTAIRAVTTKLNGN